MIVYIILIAFIIFLNFLIKPEEKKGKILFLVFSGLAIVLVMGLRYPRYEVVYDLQGYYSFYENAINLPLDMLINNSRFEVGYVLLTYFFAKIIPWAQFSLFLEAVIVIFSVSYMIYKNTKKPLLPLLFYITLGTFIFQLTGFRQSIAMSIIFFSVEFIKRKKLVPFILLVLLATMFHKTAIIFLPFYFLANRKMKGFNNIISFVALFVVIFLAKDISVLGNRFFEMNYGAVSSENIGGMIPVIIFVIGIALSLVQQRKLGSPIFFNMLIIGLAIYLMRYTTLALERVSFYYTPALIIVFTNAIDSFEDRRVKDILVFSAVVLSISLFLYRLSYMEIGSYRFFWE